MKENTSKNEKIATENEPTANVNDSISLQQEHSANARSKKLFLEYSCHERSLFFSSLKWKSLSFNSEVGTNSKSTENHVDEKNNKKTLRAESIFIVTLGFVLMCGLVSAIILLSINIGSDSDSSKASSDTTVNKIEPNSSHVPQKRKMIGRKGSIPVLLDYNIGNFRISSVLTECLHLKSAPVQNYIEMTQVNFICRKAFTSNKLRIAFLQIS